MLDSVLVWISKNDKRWVADLKEWLSIPSVSAQPDHAADVRAAGEWAMMRLRDIGLNVRMIETKRHPCVVASTPESACEPNAPHVLLYGHYDVQPPEPLELWTTGPFTPTVRDGRIYARGACDDKGQVHCHISALTAWKEINGGKLPVRLSVCLEGEEEIGSPNLLDVIDEMTPDWKTAKTLLISDTSQYAADIPSITYGLRGLADLEIFVHGANRDLHSGVYGGAVANPAHALCEIIAKLHDANGRVTVPGFYDGVQELTEQERTMWAGLPFSEKDFCAELGIKESYGEAGFSTTERRWARPTLEVNGLTSGYQGPGGKTVLPKVASAKITCRLVPNQNPAKAAEALVEHLKTLVPPGVTLEIHLGRVGPPAITPISSPAMQAATEAIEIGLGKKPIFQREGGSIPVVAWFKDKLNIDTVLLGFGLNEDQIHAPNEKLDLACYYGGIRTAAAIYDRLGKTLK